MTKSHKDFGIHAPEAGSDISCQATVETVIGWLKYQITKESNRQAGESGRKVFQRSFYDHVVRNETDYLEITRYILEDPLRWHFDKLYTEE